MNSLLVNRPHGKALRTLILEMIARHTVTVNAKHYLTIDGECIPYAAGSAALRKGAAILVGGLFVGVATSSDD